MGVATLLTEGEIFFCLLLSVQAISCIIIMANVEYN